jgi:hypothetical protein
VHLLSANEKFNPSKEIDGPNLDFNNPIKPVLNEMIQTNNLQVNPLIDNGQGINLGPRVYEDVEIVGQNKPGVPSIRLNSAHSEIISQKNGFDTSVLFSGGYEEVIKLKKIGNILICFYF